MEDSKNKTYFNKTPFRLKSSSVNKITLHQMVFLSQDNNEISNHKNRDTKTKTFSSLKRIFQPKKLNSSEKKWPKITHPKLPFTRTYQTSNESRKLKLKLEKPSKALHEFNTIKWLRKKYSDSVVEKSIHSILPKKQNIFKYKKEKEKAKRHRTMIEYLDSFKGPIGREKFIDINPKYLFDETTFKNILKLKEVFLEFDISGNQKMEFDEIVKMFNQNHIKAGKKDIFNLFFKHKVIKRKKDIMKLHLGFYQFIVFALKKEQEFRDFMRKIKLEYKKKEKNEYNNNDKEENVYLPMNFNLVLDYFIKKEKERYSIKKLKNAFDKLDNDIKADNYINRDILNDKDKINDIVNSNKINKKKIEYKKSNIGKEKKILSDVNIIELFKDFINLFYMSCKSEDENNDNDYLDLIKNNLIKTPSKIRHKTEPIKTLVDINNIDNSVLSNNKYNLKKIKRYDSRNNKSELGENILKTEKIKTKVMNNNLIGLIKNQMNKNLLNKLNINNFKKYHIVDLAKDETLKQIKRELKLDKLYINSKEKNKKNKISDDGDCINLKTINFFT